MSDKFACIILAAGNGTRMKSDLPKPMHKVAGLSLISHIILTVEELSPEKIVVVIGNNMEAMREEVSSHNCVIQQVANGTGGAVLAAKDLLDKFDGNVVVLFGDTPLIKSNSIKAMLEKLKERPENGLVFSGMELENPPAYGRMVLNNDGSLDHIVEFKDATEEERKITLCNGSVVCADGNRLFDWLEQIGNDNAQNEYYLTDLPQIARKDNRSTQVFSIPPNELSGVNSRVELAECEIEYQEIRRKEAMINGVTLTDPNTVYFNYDTEVSPDVIIGQNVVFGPNVKVESHATILPFCHIEGATIKSGASVGPFARLRPGSLIDIDAKVGNFVETKNTHIGKGSKASHLTYLGDAQIGEKVNIGAGTITCNYDGFLKYSTIIEDGAFIGSNTALVAPVKIGKGAIVGAGSTISQDAPENSLAIERSKSKVFENWAQKFREQKIQEKENVKKEK